MITKDLGLVTAYAYAVSGGYAGTEAEFTELLGNIATDLEEIENLTVTVETLPPGSEATASYADGVLHLGIPRGDKGDKGDTGETGPQGPKGDPGDVSTEQLDEAISGVRTEMEENYARNDGYYEEMTVGDAEQLISTQFVEDTEPYLFRPTGGSADVGNREYLDKIVGGTVAWNQLVGESNLLAYTSSAGVVTTKNGDGTLTINGTATGAFRITQNLATKKSHVYFATDANKQVRLYNGMPACGITNKDIGGLIKDTSSDSWNLYCYENGTAFNDTKVKPMLIDLTAMFESTIADYIYSLEQSHAGAGVAWFRQYFPEDYYPYDPGTLRSVEGVSAHETVGKNLINIADGVTQNTQTNIGFVVAPAGTYTASAFLKRNDGGACRIYMAVGDNAQEGGSNVTGSSGGVSTYTFTTTEPTTVRFGVQFLGSYDTMHYSQVQLEVGTTATAYEPYIKHTYPLDSSLTLRGVPKLVDGKLAYDGDIYPPSGEVQRRYGLRAYQSGDESLADAITDGTNTVYKLATPTTETAEGYEQYQMCDPSGTEEFVTTSIVPVGHEARYPANLRDKLQHLPDLPSPLLDGAYMVMVEGSQMKLERFLIPEAPTEDGTYTLKATVSGGTPTYAWEVEA